MFGLGFQEIILLGVFGTGFLAVLIVVILPQLGGSRTAQPGAENRRLREKLY